MSGNFISTWNRVKPVTGIKNLIELAEVVETSQPNVSKKKKEDYFPVEWAFKIGQKYGLLTEWIMLGTGPMRPSERIHEEVQTIADIKEWLAELANEDPKAKDWFEYDFQLKYPSFKEWIKKNK